nr:MULTISPECIES: RNA-binding protein [unclassified Hydrogenophaga]
MATAFSRGVRAIAGRPASLKGSVMSSKLYVGNLPYSVNDDSLRHNFSEYGAVASAKVMTDRDSGRSKGFGFVEMSSEAEAQAAINGLNGQSVDGRQIVVNISRPKEGGGGGYRSNGPRY